ncbi:hypothetical protein [Kribbella lupini]
MSSHDEPPNLNRPVMVIAMAEGVLIERYRLPMELARALLHSRAVACGLSLSEAANWLLATNTLPSPHPAS